MEQPVVFAEVVVAPVTVALVQGYKLMGLADRLAFPASLVTALTLTAGVRYASGYVFDGPNMVGAALVGLLYGLGASGLYSGVRAMTA